MQNKEGETTMNWKMNKWNFKDYGNKLKTLYKRFGVLWILFFIVKGLITIAIFAGAGAIFGK